jgi:U2-associated protein SR140
VTPVPDPRRGQTGGLPRGPCTLPAELPKTRPLNSKSFLFVENHDPLCSSPISTMSDNSKIREFPEISSKLTAPTKKSQFERQRAEAEAKRAREKAETAAVLEDFVKSFDHDEEDDRPSRADSGGRLGGGAGYGRGEHGGGMGGPSKRHFTSSSRLSGPGSLGPPPSSFTKKRTFDGEPAGRRDNTQGLFAYENSGQGHLDASTAFQASDDEDEKVGDSKAMDKASAKPTLHLSSLPPGTSPAAIKALIPTVLAVENVKILPMAGSGSGSGERKSSSAIVTLAKDSAATDIDTAVNSVQNRYLGWGFYLSISRYLSSAAVNAGVPVTTGVGPMNSLPFGARPIPQAGGNLNRAPPPGSGRGFAPPSSYMPGAFSRAPATQVVVNPPSDLKQLRLIHKTLESLLTYGPEFEALLMSRQDVQKEEKWSWLWNPRSPGGVWYRWRLWDILTDSKRQSKSTFTQYRSTAHLFDGGAPWVLPENALKFEYTTQMDEFVSDPEYNSSDEDSDDEVARRRHREHRHHHVGGPPDMLSDPAHNPEDHAYLNPLQKAKLTHLLARLPTTNARLRKGDVARVTAFAIEHAGEGADEVVDMIVSNVSHPYSYTPANPDYNPSENQPKPDDDEAGTPKDQSDDKAKEKEILDTSPSRLIALYLISDILSTSSTSGIRHAWRYRSLFETSLKTHQTFEKLGRLEKDMRWGRLKAEKWRRSVMGVLGLWEGWCVFPQDAHDRFVEVFNRPPLSERERREEEAKRGMVEGSKGAGGGGRKSKWRAVDEVEEVGGNEMDVDLDGSPMDGRGEDVDSAEMEDLDGDAMEDEDLDGVPMEEDDDDEDGGVDGEDMAMGDADGNAPDRKDDGEVESAASRIGTGLALGGGSPGFVRRTQRLKAEDMFADSDED